MEYILFDSNPSNFRVAILGVELAFEPMRRNYIEAGLSPAGMGPKAGEQVLAYKLPTIVSGGGRKRKLKALPVDQRREYFKELLPALKDLGVTHIMVTQPDYFKTLAGTAKAAHEVGSLSTVCLDHFPEYASDFQVTYAPNHKAAFFDPVKTKNSIQMASKAIVDDMNGVYVRPGSMIIKCAEYPLTINQIKNALTRLYESGVDFSSDIEAFSLNMHDAGIGSISFAIDEHEGFAFLVDPAPGIYNYEVRSLLYHFFCGVVQRGRKPKIYWHNAAYDVTVLIHQLSSGSMGRDVLPKEPIFDALTDPESMNCTKIISYLATNSTAGNKLGLKDQALEFAGNYALDEVKDITTTTVKKLLHYNLIDSLATWYVRNKNHPIMVADQQEDIYNDVFIPSLVDVVDMQLNGIPVDMEQVAKSKKELEDFQDNATRIMLGNPVVMAYTHKMKQDYVDKMHAQWVKKRITVADVDLQLNPGSAQQLQGLLFDPQFMDLPVIAKTDSGAPSTKGKHLKAMKTHTKDPDILAFLDALIDYKDSAILLSTFIPALEDARRAPDGNYYMHGNFNLGGTVSGRLSSSDPNMQNIPSKSRLSKYIKLCIKAPYGWMWVGLDYDSLEDKISALITKDPNKLKVYTDGYDGHCLRAYSYFGHHMPDIQAGSVTSINSIAVKYPKWRQDSKAPTFLLTYGGTYHGLIANCGFPKPVALSIEKNYHELYSVSDEYTADKIAGASQNGYITVAFGLRVRTPVLHQTVLGNRMTPNAAKAESRTAGNAIGQSWGLLNNRSCSAFMRKVRKSPIMRNEIRLGAQIHDAQYFLVKENVNALHFLNENLVKEVAWQNHPDITHPDVKLSGTTSVFYPTWNEEHEIPNGATKAEIIEICAGIGAKYR